jgi:hypothetical protein
MTVLCDTREPNPHPWERYLPPGWSIRARLPRNRPTSPWRGEGTPHSLDQFKDGRTRNAQLLRDRSTSQPPCPQSGHVATVCVHSLRTSKPRPSLSRGGQTRTNAFYRCRAPILLDCVEHAQKRFPGHLGSIDALAWNYQGDLPADKFPEQLHKLQGTGVLGTLERKVRLSHRHRPGAWGVTEP